MPKKATYFYSYYCYCQFIVPISIYKLYKGDINLFNCTRVCTVYVIVSVRFDDDELSTGIVSVLMGTRQDCHYMLLTSTGRQSGKTLEGCAAQVVII